VAVRFAGGFVALVWLAGCGAGPLDAVTIDPRSLAAGLVAHWTFDEGSGTVVGDRSGNGHHGQLTGGSWMSSGKFGGALDMTAGDHVTVPNFPQATTGWTVSVWIRTSAAQLTMGTMEDGETILTTENVFAGGWQLHLDNRPDYQRFDAASWAGPTVNDYVVAFCNCIVVDQWLHLAAVFDGVARELTFYRDAAVVDRRTLPLPILPGDPTLYMGRWNQNGRFLAATIDDFAIWSRALDPTEIAIVSRQPTPDLR
jgi:hypothetical protein